MLKTATRVVVNTLVLLLTRVSTVFLSIAFMAALSRHVGATGMGQYYLASSLTMITFAIANFGLSTLAVRDIARQRDKAPAYMTNLLFVKASLLIVALIITAVLAKLGNYTTTARRAIYLIAIHQSLESLSLIPSIIFRAYEQMAYESFTRIAGTVLHTGLGILGVMMGYDFIQILALLVIAGVAKFAIGLLLALWKFARPVLTLNPALCTHLLREAVPFGILVIISILYEHVHTPVLSFFAGEAAVGWYGAANRLILYLLMIPEAFVQSMFPVFSRLRTSSPGALRVSYQKSFNYLFLISFPIAAGMFLTADQIISLVYGPGFQKAIPVLRLLAWLAVFKFAGYASGASLNATGHQKLFAMVEGTFLTMNILLDIVFARLFGYLGICYARLAVAGLDLAVYSILCHRLVKLALPTEIVTKSVLATLIMALAIQGLRNSALGSLWLIISSAALVYFAALYALRAFPRSDISAVYSMIRQRG